MAGPWEQYAPPAQGPWARYAQPEPQAQQGPGAVRSFVHGATDPIQGGAQLLVNALPSGAVGAVNDAAAWLNRQPVIGPATRAIGMTPATPEQINTQTVQREADYQAQRRAAGETGTDWWRAAGQVAGSMPVAARLPVGASLPGSVVAGAGTGAALSALTPVAEPGADFWDAKRQQATSGGLVGAATGPAAYLLGRAIAPRADPSARALREAGVELTPGQAAGGMARRVEDASTSLPVIGDRVLGAQRRSLESFNRATANRVLQPLGESVPRDAQVGRELVATVEQSIGRAYDTAISRARPFGPDPQFAADIAAAGQRFLTPQARQTFISTLNDRVVSRLGNGPIDGAAFKTVDAELGAMARPFLSAASPAERELGAAVLEVQRVFRDLLARQNPQAAPLMARANEAYARFVRMQGAAAMQGATEGVFTPQQLSAAVRAADRSVRHGAYARGDALLQDLSDAGRAVLPRSIPESGTTTRALLNMATLGGAAAGGATGAIPLPFLAGAAGAYGAYSRPVSNALAGLLTRQPGPINALIGDAIAGSGGAVAVPLGAMFLSPPENRLN